MFLYHCQGEQKSPCQDTAGGLWVFEIYIFCLLIALRI